jgi:hemoglobin
MPLHVQLLQTEVTRHMTTTPDETLYRRMGGYDTIAGVVDDWLRRIREDPALARFAARSADSRLRARQLLVDQMCGLAGGPCIYTGRDMKTSHAGLGITVQEWDAGMRHAADALVHFRISDPEKQGFLALIAQYKNDIVD